MFLSTKKLTARETDLCHRTISPKAFFAIVGDALEREIGLSVVRMGDGEVRLLNAPDGTPFTAFGDEWNDRLGIAGVDIERVKANILSAGNRCTYFAPSVSGISLNHYSLHDSFNHRDIYVDNFFVNDWTFAMIKMLLEKADGAFIIHKDHTALGAEFATRFGLSAEKFSGFDKRSAQDNADAVRAAIASGKRLVLFSAGPAGKIIGPDIAESGRVVLDIGNTLPGWSQGNPR